MQAAPTNRTVNLGLRISSPRSSRNISQMRYAMKSHLMINYIGSVALPFLGVGAYGGGTMSESVDGFPFACISDPF
jgi:hypothetical protein